MFSRLNRNVVALNSQELRHAIYWGEFITFAERLADDERWSSLGLFTPNDIRRMLDIEYISEIAISILYGAQNKKDRLDEWYQVYKSSFERKSDLYKTFNTVLSELIAVFPDIHATRWRKKSDFYSLFTVLAKRSGQLPLSREGRHEIRQRLVDFGSSVNTYLGSSERVDVDREVSQYSQAVERAASDVNNRKGRESALNSILSGIFESE